MNGLYGDIRARLVRGGTEAGEAKAIALLLLEKVCGLSMTQVLTGEADRTPHRQRADLLAMAERVAQGEPVQYVLGEADFCGLTLHVEPGVLIPRPETQDLVHWVDLALKAVAEARSRHLEERFMKKIPLRHMPSRPRILDIGTGSGCIAIALASLHPEANVEAWDVSDDALRIARANAERTGVTVAFRKVDVFGPEARHAMSGLVESEAETGGDATRACYDLVVSNPPYICQSEAQDMEGNVLDHEPHLALFVPDDDPLLYYRRIAALASTGLRTGGELYFETNTRYTNDVADMLVGMRSFTHTGIRMDQYGCDRFVSAIKR